MLRHSVLYSRRRDQVLEYAPDGGWGICNGQSADRSALQQALSRVGIEVKAPRSFQRDIDRLKELTASTLKGLEEFSRPRRAVRMVRRVLETIERAEDDPVLLLGTRDSAYLEHAKDELSRLLRGSYKRGQDDTTAALYCG